MKIWCDMCDKEEASLFCCADEAALCNSCDHRVHFANKLSRQHLRFSLSSSPNSFKDSPLCDICKERRALLFCQEDRAILCRECDIRIHEANDLTKKHNRFLLTGVKISNSSTVSNAKSISGEVPSSASNNNNNNVYMNSSPSTTSNYNNTAGSISEYLMETLPGWQVEDLLDHPSYQDNNDSNTSLLYDASSQYHHHHHHQGFWEQNPFS